MPVTVAFPEAQGYGAETLKNAPRGNVNLIKVTNTNDSGTGSLRWAFGQLQSGAYNIIIFRVGGTITLSSRIENITTPYIYIAGQTAPGDGILITGHSIRFQSGTHNICIRYLRRAVGDDGTSPGQGQTYFSFEHEVHDVIIDHCTGVWTLDEGIHITRDYNTGVTGDYGDNFNYTVQRCILAEGLSGHSTGGVATGGGADNLGNTGVYDISWHHNLFATNNQRNPLVKNKGTEVVNNLIYNVTGEIGQSMEGEKTDWESNDYRAGPAKPSPGVGDRLIIEQTTQAGDFNVLRDESSFYVENNKAPDYGIAVPTDDNWPLVRDNRNGEVEAPAAWQRFTRLTQPSFPITVEAIANVFDSVTGDVGANAQLDNDGNLVSNQDPITSRIVTYTINDTGPADLITHQDDVGGFPTMNNGTAYADDSGDGMANAWKEANGLVAGDDDLLTTDDDGYLYLERFLNQSSPSGNGSPGGGGTVITETFPGADQDVLDGDLTWTEVHGDWDRVSNKAKVMTTSAGNYARAESDLDTSDHYCQADDTGSSAQTSMIRGVSVRCNATDSARYELLVRNTSTGTYRIFRRDATNNADLIASANNAAGQPVGVVIRLEVTGDSLEGFIDGVSVITATDGVITAGTRVGLGGQIDNVSHDLLLDNVEGGDLPPEGTFNASPVALSLAVVAPTVVPITPSPVGLTLAVAAPAFKQVFLASAVQATLTPTQATFIPGPIFEASPVALTLTTVAPNVVRVFSASPVQATFTVVATSQTQPLPLVVELSVIAPAFVQRVVVPAVALSLAVVGATLTIQAVVGIIDLTSSEERTIDLTSHQAVS